MVGNKLFGHKLRRRICEVSHLRAGAGEAVPHAEQPLHQLCHCFHGVAYAVLSDEQTKLSTCGTQLPYMTHCAKTHSPQNMEVHRKKVSESK
jgi:hypothetical protein